ncbi:MAG: bifunctional riboflavin kinase/FAD synthetase [Bacteroidota bacterium]
MKVYQGVESFPNLPHVVLTMGTFDGVHYGHRKILKRLLDTAKMNEGTAVVMTFHPHPRAVLFPEQTNLKLLSTVSEKIALLDSIGVEHLIIQPFDLEFSKVSHRQFVEDFLIDKIKMKCMVVGYDHQFGHNRQGNFDELMKLSTAFDFEVEKIPEQEIEEIVVSSTKIRNALSSGDVVFANQLLTYRYPLSGKVVKGNQIGRTLGFPTANILLSDSFKLIPEDGVYSCKVVLNDELLNGIVSIGNRPTFNDSKKSIEVHIFNFDKDIYDETITIEFVKYVRAQKKFNLVDDLVVQIREDIAHAIEHLG